jgi:ribosomal-protein-alanine N-acetyltransferase
VSKEPKDVVHIVPMRRRHVKSVVKIEEQVYPRPWSMPLFLSELALRTTRTYFVARVGREVVGYGGLMMSADDGHVTTIAVDPEWQRHRIGTRLMVALAREALARKARHLTLEVRLSNLGAQHLYRRFGFAPVGVRKNYYQLSPGTPGAVHASDPEATVEDALVMWAHEIDSPDYAALLESIAGTIPGETVYEDPKR